MKAIWQDTVIAESDETIVIENNHYFPSESVNHAFLVDSDTHTTCPWKGEASYKSIQIGANTNEDAAWYYPNPKDAAESIQGYYAFYRGVKIEE